MSARSLHSSGARSRSSSGMLEDSDSDGADTLSVAEWDAPVLNPLKQEERLRQAERDAAQAVAAWEDTLLRSIAPSTIYTRYIVPRLRTKVGRELMDWALFSLGFAVLILFIIVIVVVYYDRKIGGIDFWWWAILAAAAYCLYILIHFVMKLLANSEIVVMSRTLRHGVTLALWAIAMTMLSPYLSNDNIAVEELLFGGAIVFDDAMQTYSWLLLMAFIIGCTMCLRGMLEEVFYRRIRPKRFRELFVMQYYEEQVLHVICKWARRQGYIPREGGADYMRVDLKLPAWSKGVFLQHLLESYREKRSKQKGLYGNTVNPDDRRKVTEMSELMFAGMLAARKERQGEEKEKAELGQRMRESVRDRMGRLGFGPVSQTDEAEDLSVGTLHMSSEGADGSSGTRRDRVYSLATSAGSEGREYFRRIAAQLRRDGEADFEDDLEEAEAEEEHTMMLQEEDFRHIFGKSGCDVEFLVFDRNLTGEVGCGEFSLAVLQIFGGRQEIVHSFNDFDNMGGIFRALVRTIYWIIIVIVALLLAGLDIMTGLLPAAGVFVGFSFAFGNTIRIAIESIYMLLYSNPFNVGERLVFPGDPKGYFVWKVGLFRSEFFTTDGRFHSIPNEYLLSNTVMNYARSGDYTIETRVAFAANATSGISLVSLKQRVTEYVLQNSDMYRSDILINLGDLRTQQNELLMDFWIPLQGVPWDKVVVYLDIKTEFLVFLVSVLEEMNLSYRLPEQDIVLLSGAGGGGSRRRRDFGTAPDSPSPSGRPRERVRSGRYRGQFVPEDGSGSTLDDTTEAEDIGEMHWHPGRRRRFFGDGEADAPQDGGAAAHGAGESTTSPQEGLSDGYSSSQVDYDQEPLPPGTVLRMDERSGSAGGSVGPAPSSGYSSSNAYNSDEEIGGSFRSARHVSPTRVELSNSSGEIDDDDGDDFHGSESSDDERDDVHL